jgi:MFS family permease
MSKIPGSVSSDRNPASAEKGGPFASLRVRNFRLLLTGTTLSSTANWIQQVIMNWLAYDLTGSGTILGSINLARSVAMFGLVPVTGLMIDRLNHRRLMLITNTWMFSVSLGMGLILIFSHIQVSYLFIFRRHCVIC